MNSPHPRIILVGAKATGKSTLVGGICGISLGTSTTCPIEWHLRRSSTWSAEVSVAYLNSPLWSSGKFVLNGSRRIFLSSQDSISTPRGLQCLVRKAELLAFSPGQSLSDILSLSDEDMDREHSNILLSSSHSQGVVCVYMRSPSCISNKMTVIDLPGYTETGYSTTIKHFRDLIRYYAMGREKSVVALFPGVSEQEHKVPAHQFLTRIGKDSRSIMMIIARTQAEVHTNATSLVGLIKPHHHRYLSFLAPDRRAPIALSDNAIQQNRLEEAAYFQFCEPWSTQPMKNNLGISNIVKEWASQWALLQKIEEGTPKQTGSWSTIFIIIAVITFLSMLLNPRN